MPDPTRPLHLAVALDRPGPYAAEPYAGAARLAERGCLDFVTLGDAPGPPGGKGDRPDALAVLARVASATERIGLVPTVTAAHAEPFQLSSALATLDRVSRGRAGWTVEVPAGGAQARVSGRRGAPDAHAAGREAGAAAAGREAGAVAAGREAGAAAAWREAGVVAGVVARLWDGREDDAGSSAVATGRWADRDTGRRAGFEGPGCGGRAPAVVPRPPQGRPVTAVD
ncbi:LLM class flavin-dependent oxidoreductase, partial [Streptomyces cinnamoneus]|uniref:LLM class flavin-dependent oxidoreductase n=1 Tax=Streptomyces cinnamoneus TaxID=53446 RepID=UPI003449AC03